MDASTPVWRRTAPKKGDFTSRDLYSKHASTLTSILLGAANDAQGDCAGLIFTFQFAQNVVAKHFGIGYHPVPAMNIYNNAGDSLYFHSYDQRIPEGYWQWDGPTDYYNTYWIPRWNSGYRPFHFFTKRGVQIPRPPGL